MPWNETTRAQYIRVTERYASDLTDAEWELLVPLLPLPKRLGRPREVNMREVVNAILYLLWTGCAWRALPKDFPAFTTVQHYFYAWSRSGVLDRIGTRLTDLERMRCGRRTEPSAAVVDSQSVPTVEAGRAGSGYDDAGKRVKGRKRHIAVDVDGNLLAAQVHPAGVQDRDGAVPLLVELHRRRSTVQTVFADGGYAGDKLRTALREAGCQVTVDVVRKPADSKGFEVLPRRWVVERTFGWLRRCRRLSKDFERTMASGLAWLRLALVRVLVRRLARHQVSVTY